MYALGVSFLLATSNAFSPMGGRVNVRMANKMSMSTMVSPVATEAILATVSQLIELYFIALLYYFIKEFI